MILKLGVNFRHSPHAPGERWMNSDVNGDTSEQEWAVGLDGSGCARDAVMSPAALPSSADPRSGAEVAARRISSAERLPERRWPGSEADRGRARKS